MMFVVIVVAIAVVVVVIVVNTVNTAPYKSILLILCHEATAISSYVHKTHNVHARLKDLPVPPRYPRG